MPCKTSKKALKPSNRASIESNPEIPLLLELLVSNKILTSMKNNTVLNSK